MKSAGVFNYSPHNLAGGHGHVRLTLGPRKEAREGLIPPAKPPEGEYTSKKKGTMSVVEWRANLRWLRQRQAAGITGEPETLHEWNMRHPIIGVATAECDICHAVFYGKDAIRDCTGHLQEHGPGHVVYA